MKTYLITRELGDPIAVGRTAEVYNWEPGWVLKLYFDRFDPGIADFEHRIATAISTAGISAPAVGDIVCVNGRMGLLYEYCEGDSMDDDLQRHFFHGPSHARKWLNLHAEMHAKPMQADILQPTASEVGTQNSGCKTLARKPPHCRAQSA